MIVENIMMVALRTYYNNSELYRPEDDGKISSLRNEINR